MSLEKSEAMKTGVVVVGASHAGVECAWALRASGYLESILLIDAESEMPYQRPPLSKSFLAGETPADRIVLRSPSAYEQQRIDTLFGETVNSLSVEAKTLQLASGRIVQFEHCVLATGASARSLPGLSGDNVHAIRTRADSERFREALAPGLRLLVIGGGYLGMEAASTAVKMGVHVKVLEQAAGLMAGRISGHTSSRFEAMHRESGISMVLGATIQEAVRKGREWQIALTDGNCIDADIILIAVGAGANLELASRAGLTCSDGIEVTDACRTSADDIYAIGDCAVAYRAELGRYARVESVQNALSQARFAAAAIAGAVLPERRPCTFWSEQQGRRLQIAGLPSQGLAYEDVVTPTKRGWLVERFQKNKQLCAVEAIDSPVEFQHALKRLNESTHAVHISLQGEKELSDANS